MELAEQEQLEQTTFIEEMKQGVDGAGEEVEEDAVKSQIMRLTNVSSSTSAYILQALLAAREKDRLEEILDGE